MAGETAIDGRTFDVIVVGSGAAGMIAALTAAVGGATVLVLEKTSVLGGTTSYSEAMAWVPMSDHAKAANASDNCNAALAYLSDVAGVRFDRARCTAYVDNAAPMLRFLEQHSAVRYRLATGSVDYYPDKAGATRGVRALSVGAFDGRRLGRSDFARLRWPLKTALVLGGMSIASADIAHFYKVFRSWPATRRVAALVARYALDRLAGWPRGTAIANGDGVIAALLLEIRQRGGLVLTDANVSQLISTAGCVHGVVASIGGERATVLARCGVLLATGGFSASPEQRQRFAPASEKGGSHITLTAEGATGDGIVLAEAAGAAVTTDLDQPMAWAPTSWVPYRGAGFPHFIERAKPGIIVVDRQGRRFVNEAVGYHDFVPAMIARCAADDDVAAWIIADHSAQRRYGLGAAPPAPGRLGPALRSGYLITAPTLAELAVRTGVNAAALQATVARFNDAARAGRDTEFGRGESAHNRAYGDPGHQPNPCLGALETGPFYAVKLRPGDLGSFVGLATDANARVLDKAGHPLSGLYAAGLDAASVLGGHYPAAGVTVGAALTFGWIAARHALGNGLKAPGVDLDPVTRDRGTGVTGEEKRSGRDLLGAYPAAK